MHITVPQSNTIRAILATSFGLFWGKRGCRGEDRCDRARLVATDAGEMDRTVLAARRTHLHGAHILMRTGSSFQKRSNCVRANGRRRAVSMLQIAVGMVRIVCAIFAAAADSLKQHIKIIVQTCTNRTRIGLCVGRIGQ